MEKERKILFILSFIVVASVLYGFFSIGNPAELRNRKLDQTRENDIASLKSSVETYYSRHGGLPSRLYDMKINYPYISEKKDPETGREYDYHWEIDTLFSYKLCATFSTATYDTANINQNYNSKFSHPKGYYCFSFTVPSSLYVGPTPYVPTPTPTLNPQNYSVLQSCKLDLDASSKSDLKIMGIYELEDSVLFTTNKIANATINYWTDPKIKGNAVYMYGLSVFDTKIYKVTGYKIRVFDASGDEDTSQEYIFQGNRTVKKDPRCESSLKLTPTPTYVNLALNKTVSSSSSVEVNGWSAVNATDGNYSTGWSSDNNLSANHSEWITVDLGSSLLINKVTLVPRADVGKIGFYFPIDFTIQISTDNVKFTRVVRKVNYPNPLSSPQSFTFKPVNARYVKIEGTNLSNVEWEAYRMQFEEIEVYNTL